MSDWMETVMYKGDYGCIGCERTEYKFGYLPVTIYADITRQYTEEEIDEMMEKEFWGQMIEIPVPEDLLFKWWQETFEYDCFSRDKFHEWFYEESIVDDTDTLYDWLVAHNYCWKRLD